MPPHAPNANQSPTAPARAEGEGARRELSIKPEAPAWDRRILIVGKGLTPPEQAAAIDRVCVLPTIIAAQWVLDELIGQINNPHRRMPIANPLRYLKTLVEQSLAGCFQPELAFRESGRRESRHGVAGKS